MWHDIETSKDLLNFMVVAETAAQLVRDSSEQPISIGISGGWGTGKSSLVEMIGQSLQQGDSSNDKYIFLKFNAWLYQGYDDAKLALLQAVSDKLLQTAKERETGFDKAIEFAKRINWLQVSKLLVPATAGAVLGGTVAGPLGALVGAAGALLKNSSIPSAEDVENLRFAYSELSPELTGLIKDKSARSMPQEIEALRTTFEELLGELNLTLVLLIDDLDRCLPETAISTLEAMRLLLFIPRTAFIIAADEQMIRNAVRSHFGSINLSDEHVTSYFDKLIQVPLRVPNPGICEIKGYLTLLFAEEAERNGIITQATRLTAQEAILKDVSQSWAGGLTRKKIEQAFGDDREKMNEKIDLADQLAHLMISADHIRGNPRLIKRFLNNLLIRESIAKAQGLPIKFDKLVKMQLFERCATTAAFDYLTKNVNQENGKLPGLADMEASLAKGEKPKIIHESWNSEFIEEWLNLSPKLGDEDLRPYLYLSRSRSMIFASYDEISEEALSLLEAILVTNDIVPLLVEKLKTLGEAESERILNRIMRVVREKQWEIEPIIQLFHVTEAFPQMGAKLANFLAQVPPNKRKPMFIPLMRDKEWAEDTIHLWRDDPSSPAEVIAAIKRTKHNNR